MLSVTDCDTLITCNTCNRKTETALHVTHGGAIKLSVIINESRKPGNKIISLCSQTAQ